MKKSRSANMLKGIGIGMAIGGITAAVGSTVMTDGKSMSGSGKKTAAKAVKAVGDMIDNIQYMMK